MDKYVIYDKEMGEIFTGSFELYKEMIKGVKFLDPEDTKLALQLIRENNNMDDLFHTLNFYGINIFGEEYKDLRIERLEAEINMNEVNKNIENLIKEIRKDIDFFIFSLKVEWERNYVELKLVSPVGEEKKVYERVTIYNNGTWTAAGVLNKIQSHLDENLNLNKVEADSRMQNYTVIISQYMGEQHQFMVQRTRDFETKLQKMVKELQDYKSTDGFVFCTNELYEFEESFDTFNGDIYVFTNDSYKNAMEAILISKLNEKESAEYFLSFKDNRSKNHNYEKVKEIINKYFEII